MPTNRKHRTRPIHEQRPLQATPEDLITLEADIQDAETAIALSHSVTAYLMTHRRGLLHVQDQLRERLGIDDQTIPDDPAS